jgi:hypothetical protein
MNSPYHFTPNFTPHFSAYSSAARAPHANQFQAPAVPHIENTYLKHRNDPVHAIQQHQVPHAMDPAAHEPQNSYVADGKVTNITTHQTLRAGQKLKPGDVVEVERGGHTEFAYVNYNNQLKQINQAVMAKVPNELRDHIQKVGGPHYFAHELHNRIPTQALHSQFSAGDNRGPNRPLI